MRPSRDKLSHATPVVTLVQTAPRHLLTPQTHPKHTPQHKGHTPALTTRSTRFRAPACSAVTLVPRAGRGRGRRGGGEEGLPRPLPARMCTRVTLAFVRQSNCSHAILGYITAQTQAGSPCPRVPFAHLPPAQHPRCEGRRRGTRGGGAGMGRRRE